jgi:hypothetical protein
MPDIKEILLIAAVCCAAIAGAEATPLTIYEIQYTTDPSGDSPYKDQTADCSGGIVINKWAGGRTKLTLYDPSNPDGWGGIIVKTPGTEFDGIQVGDWVSFTGVLIEERSGNTQLSYELTSGISVVSTGNILPDAIDITASAFGEQYESMRVKVSDVEITAMDLGVYGDNYNLQNGNGDYWASDYMNVEAGGPYHSYVSVGATFESVSGIIEHKISGEWDYYQLLTTGTSDFIVPEQGAIVLMAGGALLLRKYDRRQRTAKRASRAGIRQKRCEGRFFMVPAEEIIKGYTDCVEEGILL